MAHSHLSQQKMYSNINIHLWTTIAELITIENNISNWNWFRFDIGLEWHLLSVFHNTNMMHIAHREKSSEMQTWYPSCLFLFISCHFCLPNPTNWRDFTCYKRQVKMVKTTCKHHKKTWKCIFVCAQFESWSQYFSQNQNVVLECIP